MRLSQFCKNELQLKAQYSFTYQAQYTAKKYICRGAVWGVREAGLKYE